MSLFRSETLDCPRCDTPVAFEVADSINADRRPDLRDAILEGSFQKGTCPSCGVAFRVSPDLSYLDVGRGQWVLALPYELRPRWAEVEQHARDLFARGFGPAAPVSARLISERVSVRVVFGWSGLSEKLLCAEHGLDDAVLESLKISLLRHGEAVRLRAHSTLRLVAVADDALSLGWLVADEASPDETLVVPRELFEMVAVDAAWTALRADLAAGPFVDFDRLLVEA
jgi:hypothetical protein